MNKERRFEVISNTENKEYVNQYLRKIGEVINRLDLERINAAVDCLAKLKNQKGRLFILGVGGSASNCAHAVNDFRKIAGVEAYAPTDNVAELTARTNDDGWETVFSEWLRTSRLASTDVVMIFSVGGGSLERNISPNIVRALELARERQSKIIGIVSRDGGYTAKVADVSIIIPPVYEEMITPFAESIQGVIWHLLANHPSVRA